MRGKKKCASPASVDAVALGRMEPMTKKLFSGKRQGVALTSLLTPAGRAKKPPFLRSRENPSGSAIASSHAARFFFALLPHKVLHLEGVSRQRGNRLVSSCFLLLQTADK
jgi:hypothetical protein